jgi:hypothetical protein
VRELLGVNTGKSKHGIAEKTIGKIAPEVFRVLAVCLVTVSLAAAQDPKAESTRHFRFPSNGVAFDAAFDGARLNDCDLENGGEYRVVIRAEDEPINDSAWYAFRITAPQPQTITIRLTYEGGQHRYHPKLSLDGKVWRRISDDRYQSGEDSATLRVDIGPEPVLVSAQEMIGVAELSKWMDEIAELPFVDESVLGHSVGNRPIRQLTLATGEPEYAVVIVGRQHPPEVTGSMALMEFVETIAGPGALALSFRQSFETVVVPLVNPDGVAAGNWRHNLHGVDLNRDWGPFRQPETRVVRDSILKYQQDDTPQPALFLDFHSTHHDVFYVQDGEASIWPEDFCDRWLKSLADRLPEYEVRTEPNAGTRPLSKVWARRTLGIPAVIYEVGDNTDRRLIRSVARTAAEEMMSLLLAEIELAPIGTGGTTVPAN